MQGPQADVGDISAAMVVERDVVGAIYMRKLYNLRTNEAVIDVSNKIILNPKNRDALKLNNDVRALIPGESTQST